MFEKKCGWMFSAESPAVDDCGEQGTDDEQEGPDHHINHPEGS